MALILPIPVDAGPDFTLQCDLDLKTYILGFRWNVRDEAWFMSISDVEGSLVLDSRKIVVDTPLVRRFRDPKLPPGELVAQDTTGKQQDPGLLDFGSRVLILYFTAAEITELYG